MNFHHVVAFKPESVAELLKRIVGQGVMGLLVYHFGIAFSTTRLTVRAIFGNG